MNGFHPRGVSIFVFHSVESNVPADRSWVTSEERFRAQLDFIAENYAVLTVSQMLSTRHSRKTGKPTACITFDDGDPSWSALVRKELSRRQLNATFYVSTDELNGKPIWHDRLAFCLASITSTCLDLPWLGIRNMPYENTVERILVADRLGRMFKYQYSAVRQKMLMTLEETLGVSCPRRGLSGLDLEKLLEDGHEIGSHTKSHPILTFSDDHEAFAEICESKEILSALLKTPIKSFSYPNGKPGTDYLAKHVSMVERAGYTSAVSTSRGSFKEHTSPFQIPRFTPWGRSAHAMKRQVFINSLLPPKVVSNNLDGKKKRILVVENGAGFGGSVVALKTAVQEAESLAYDIGIIAGEDFGLGSIKSINMLRCASSRSRHPRKFEKYLGRIIESLPRQFQPFLLSRVDDLFARLPYLLKLLRLAYSFKPDIIHGNNELVSNREALIVAQLLRIPYVQHVRGPFPEKVKLSYLVKRPDLYIAVSRWLFFSCLERDVPLGKMIQIYDGVSMPHKDQSLRGDVSIREGLKISDVTPVVALVGMLIPWKGQQIFIDAAARIREISPDVIFLVVGSQPDLVHSEYECELRRLVEHNKLIDSVIFTGQIKDLHARMGEFDIVVSASVKPEPLGLIMIEALQRGVFFVGPDHGATAEFITDPTMGALFKAGSGESLAQTILMALSGIKERKNCVNSLPLEFMEETSPSSNARSVSSCYQSILAIQRQSSR